jgi:hypothetical protein
MRLARHCAFGTAFVFGLGLCGCGGGMGGGEPSESQMKEAMLYEMNHPADGSTIAAPITIKFFKKEACDKPTPQGYNCTFQVQVASSNLAAGFYNDIPGAVFYKDDKGKWQMRPPFPGG